jgi:hypothetical protein
LLTVHLSEPPPCTPSPHRYTLTSPTKLHVSFLIIVQLLKMEDSIILSPSVVNHKPKENWKPPICSTVCSLRRQGMSYGKIKKLTGLKRSTIHGIVKAVSSHTTRKGKATKCLALKPAEVRRIFHFVSESWTNCTKSWARIKAELHLEASTSTIKIILIYSNL